MLRDKRELNGGLNEVDARKLLFPASFKAAEDLEEATVTTVTRRGKLDFLHYTRSGRSERSQAKRLIIRERGVEANAPEVAQAVAID